MSAQYAINGYIKVTHYIGDKGIRAQVYCKTGKLGDIYFPVSKADSVKLFDTTVQVKIVIDVYDGYFGVVYTAYVVIPFLLGLIKIESDERWLHKTVYAIENKLIRNATKTFYN